MLSNNIRNIIVRQENDRFVINDRKILEFYSRHARNDVYERKVFADIKVGALNLDLASVEMDDLAISIGAKLLMSVVTPFLLFENSILTPWDVVMKTSGKDFMV